MQDMDLVLEEEFLELMVHLLRSLPMQDIWQVGMDAQHHAADYADQEADILRNLQVLTPQGGLVTVVNMSAIIIGPPQKSAKNSLTQYL